MRERHQGQGERVGKGGERALTTLVNHDDTRFLASDEGLDKAMTSLIVEKGLRVRTKRNCVVTFARIADDPEVASLMSAKKNPEQLLKNFFNFVDKTDDTDTEKWALIALARLSLNDDFSNSWRRRGTFRSCLNSRWIKFPQGNYPRTVGHRAPGEE